jgi:hypothetical protein
MRTAALCYVAGVATFAAFTHSATTPRALAWSFLAGAIAAVLVAAGLLSSARRIRRAARFLAGVATAIEGRRKPHVVKARKSAEPELAGVAGEVVSALVNLKASKPAAIAAVRQAQQAAPAAGFQELFNVALSYTRKAA